MEPAASVEVGIIGIFLIAFVFAWDGLVRRHIRLIVDFTQHHIGFRGLPAMLFGGLWLIVALIDIKSATDQLARIAAACRYEGACLVHTVLIPPFTTWYTVILLLIGAVAFGMWARGALDMHGPYRQVRLARGVWMREQDVLAFVSKRLQKAHLPPEDRDTILAVATWVRGRIGFLGVFAREGIINGGRLDPEALTDILIHGSSARNFRMSQESLRIVVLASAKYFQDVSERAAKVWQEDPWYRRRLGRPQR